MWILTTDVIFFSLIKTTIITVAMKTNMTTTVKIDSRGRSLRNTCNFTTFNADSSSYGTYQVFNNEGQQILVYKDSTAIQKCNIVVEKTQISSEQNNTTTFLVFFGLVCLILFMPLV